MPRDPAVTERNLGVPRDYASFAVPLGATTKMDGCAAIYPAIAAIFVAQFFGIQLGFTDYLLIAFVSVLGSAATAGLTGAVVMLTLTLSTLGLPLAGVGLLLAIDPILDMGRTAVNVAGQALVPTIVAKREGILDLERYASASAEDLFSDDEGRASETSRDLARVRRPESVARATGASWPAPHPQPRSASRDRGSRVRQQRHRDPLASPQQARAHDRLGAEPHRDRVDRLVEPAVVGVVQGQGQLHELGPTTTPSARRPRA